MGQPDGYSDPRKRHWVCHLKRRLCGLVWSGRTWNEELISCVESEGFPATLKDPAVCVKCSRNREVFAGGRTQVDDFVRIGPRKEVDILSRRYQHDV